MLIESLLFFCFVLLVGLIFMQYKLHNRINKVSYLAIYMFNVLVKNGTIVTQDTDEGNKNENENSGYIQ